MCNASKEVAPHLERAGNERPELVRSGVSYLSRKGSGLRFS